MQARLFLLLILLLVTTSFFWEDEEKQLRHLHQNGENALQKKDFEGAKKAFEELLERVDVEAAQKKYQVDWTTYVDVVIRLATAYDELNQKEEADSLLALFLTKHPPDDMATRVKLMRARLSATRQSPAEAYIEMKRLAKQVPFTQWPEKELSFFRALEYSLDVYYDELLRKAKLHLLAGCYSEATALYEDVHTALERECYPKIKDPQSLIAKTVRYRLAECYYLIAKFDASLKLCADQKPDGDQIDQEMLYLQALCYREKKEYEKALELFENYTHLAAASELQHYEHALYEMGHTYYLNGDKAKARRFFEKLQSHENKPSQLAKVLLARMHLEEKNPHAADALLAHLTPYLNQDDLLLYECEYLRGRAAYDRGAYDKAQEYFIRSIQKKGKWYNLALYHLGWCYIRLDHNDAFNKAEEIFQYLIDTDQHQEACLSLAQLYVLSRDPLTKLDAFLTPHMPSFTREGQIEAYLLRAEVASSYEEKEKIYAQAASEKFQSSPLFGHVWYCRGLNHFQQGLKTKCQPAAYFEAAAAAFEKAFRNVESIDQDLAAHILKWEAKAHVCRNSPMTSLVLLEKLLADFKEQTQEHEETLYLRGLLAAQFADSSLAEESLQKVISDYSQGKYFEEALYTLGILYYRKEQYPEAQALFCRLAEECPDSAHRPEAWFWAAEAATRAGENAMALRQHVYEDYPAYERAAEAYFRQYPYSRYLEGGTEAIAHLRAFSGRFPDSPLTVVAHYLLEVHAADLVETLAEYDLTVKAFADYQNAQAPQFTYIYFRYQALLQLASRYLEEGSPVSLEKCEALLLSLVSDFEHPSHPLTSILKQKSLYPALFEEGEFKLAQVYLKGEKKGLAQQILQQMLGHYQQAGIHEGYYLSQVWLEQGRLAMSCEDYDTALNCFEIALASNGPRGAPVNETHLTLWLLESDCFRAKNQLGVAMRLLSKVINAETASPLRLKAMFLRSEIYELEGRPELAIRQLEATAKKGGEWAQKAQEKLRGNYGIQ